MNLTVQGTHLDLTPEVRRLLDHKLAEALRGLGSTHPEPITIHVELERTACRYREHPDDRHGTRRFRAEATMALPGTMLRAEGAANNLTRAIVQMKHGLARQIRDWRSRREDYARGREAIRRRRTMVSRGAT